MSITDTFIRQNRSGKYMEYRPWGKSLRSEERTLLRRQKQFVRNERKDLYRDIPGTSHPV